ncbi:MAG: hypothetical protein IIX06_03360, partial [Bacteroidales bacterium]|nr:hypothetical protein [Bacteroidales bacterium]
MANGVIVESRIQATNIDALNRTAQAEVAVAGGGLVALTASGTQGNEVWTAAAPASGTLGGLWIAYNPAEHLTVVGDKVFAGLSEDPRDYVNVANRPFDCFKPQVGDEIDITIDCVDASGASAVAGDILESKAGQTTFQRIAASTGATAGSTAFKIEYVGVAP